MSPRNDFESEILKNMDMFSLIRLDTEPLDEVMTTEWDMTQIIDAAEPIHLDTKPLDEVMTTEWDMTQIIDAAEPIILVLSLAEEIGFLDHCIMMSAIPDSIRFERIQMGPIPEGFSPIVFSNDPFDPAPWENLISSRPPSFISHSIHGNVLILMERDRWWIERHIWKTKEDENILFCRSSLRFSPRSDAQHLHKILVMMDQNGEMMR